MMSPCDVVAERLALDEPLAELTQHADDCPRCQGLLSAQRTLTSSHRDANHATPAHGFASRMTVAANQRLVVRHRRRVAGYATLSAAAAALLTFFLVREPARTAPPPVAATTLESETKPTAEDPANPPDDPWQSDANDADQAANDVEEPEPLEVAEEPTLEEPGERDEEAIALHRLSRLYATPVHARWKRIAAPLDPYKRLLQQAGN
jgi:hypothetical protein